MTDSILNINNISNNTLFPFCESGNRINDKKRKLIPGDIIEVQRKLPYKHFAVYAGNGRVIHFAAPNGDWNGTPVIHEAPFENFMRDSDSFEILEFEQKRTENISSIPHGMIKHISPNSMLTVVYLDVITNARRNAQYTLYSPEETVNRARQVADQCAREKSQLESFLNGHKYNLIFNNCEHFAIWCKTGVHESRQVDKILNTTRGVMFSIAS